MFETIYRLFTFISYWRWYVEPGPNTNDASAQMSDASMKTGNKSFVFNSNILDDYLLTNWFCVIFIMSADCLCLTISTAVLSFQISDFLRIFTLIQARLIAWSFLTTYYLPVATRFEHKGHRQLSKKITWLLL